MRRFRRFHRFAPDRSPALVRHFLVLLFLFDPAPNNRSGVAFPNGPDRIDAAVAL
jgi:hypothetical protein